MMRITEHATPEGVTLALEGGLTGRWVDELERVTKAYTQATRALGASPAAVEVQGISEGPKGSRKLGLSLAQVTYVDSRGVELLRQLLQTDAEIIDQSRFVAELLGTTAKSGASA